MATNQRLESADGSVLFGDLREFGGGGIGGPVGGASPPQEQCGGDLQAPGAPDSADGVGTLRRLAAAKGLEAVGTLDRLLDGLGVEPHGARASGQRGKHGSKKGKGKKVDLFG